MSDGTFPQRLTKVDELTRSDHYWLEPDDECLFLGEYTARKGYNFSTTNQLIFNFKKSPKTRGSAQWKYKERAINVAAQALRTALTGDWLDTATFVPMPPSKAKSDPLYDDRVTRLAQAIRPSAKVDVRELIIQETSTEAVHDSEERPTPDEQAGLYSLDQASLMPRPRHIVLLDDLLVAGCHFKAAQKILMSPFPGVRVTGLFLARRVPEAMDPSAFFTEVSE
jgi:predicted amidophosphoribosyltransferase